jgi:tetratricopeptide (TPR) repeat protein
MMTMRHLALALCLMIAAASAAAAPAPWVEVKSAHFTVITDAGDKAGRKTAWQFEQIRLALLEVWPWAKIDSGSPFVVFAARDENTLRTLGPQYWEGKRYRPVSFGAHGRDRQYIALRIDVNQPDDVGANPYQSAYWSYSSAVFNRSFPRRLPAWYSRGIAEVMSNTIVRDKELHVGRPLRSSLQTVREHSLVPLSELLTADSSSRWRTDEVASEIFDANAWALVYYLMFGDERAHAPKVNQFNRLLYSGADPDAALREAFGDMKPYQVQMKTYMDRSLFAYVRIPVSLDTKPEAYAVRTLPPAESAVLRGELLAAMDRPVEARAFAAEAAKADPGSPGPWEIEASLLEEEKRTDEVKSAYAKAAERGSQRAHVYYRLAQLEWTPNADKEAKARLAASLEKARALEPTSADTLSFLADLKVDLGQGEEALPLVQKAVEIEPAGSYHRLALARVLWSLKRSDEAVRAAQSALQAADDDSERKYAQDFLDFAGRARTRRAPTPRPAEDDSSGARDAVTPETLDRACRTGDKRACAQIAVLQAQGEGIPRDRPRALSTLKGLCDEGFDDGCVGWAIVLASGSRTDVAKAKQLLDAVCERGSVEACQLSKSMR